MVVFLGQKFAIAEICTEKCEGIFVRTINTVDRGGPAFAPDWLMAMGLWSARFTPPQPEAAQFDASFSACVHFHAIIKGS